MALGYPRSRSHVELVLGLNLRLLLILRNMLHDFPDFLRERQRNWGTVSKGAVVHVHFR